MNRNLLLSLVHRSFSTEKAVSGSIIRVNPGLSHRDPEVSVYTPEAEIEHIPVTVPRLEQHYFNTLAQDLLVLNYDHFSPNAPLEAAKQLDAWNHQLPSDHLKRIFSVPLEDLATEPFSELGGCTNLISKESCREIKKRRRIFFKGNPIDFVGKTNRQLNKAAKVTETRPFEPTYNGTPALKKVELRVISEEALTNKTVLYAALMSLTQITGVTAKPLFAERASAQQKIRAGMPLGALSILKEQKMFDFVDKLVHVVLPRLREWKGIVPKKEDHGAIVLNLKASEVGYFPDLEPHFDMYPKLFDVEISFFTNTDSAQKDATLLSGFGIPVDEAALEQLNEVQEVEEVDPWAKYKEVKVKESVAPIRGILQKRNK